MLRSIVTLRSINRVCSMYVMRRPHGHIVAAQDVVAPDLGRPSPGSGAR